MARPDRTFPAAAAFLLVMGAPPLGAQEAGGPASAPPPAAELVRRVAARQQSPGFRARARAETDGPGGAAVTQLALKGRRDGGRARLLIAALWPPAARGAGVMIDRLPDGRVSGFEFDAGGVRPLGEETLRRGLFDTAVRPEDFLQPFWEWPSQTAAGAERVGREECWVILSRPDPGRAFPMVRTAVSREKEAPVRIEVFGAGGEAESVVFFERLHRREEGEGWAAASFTVETPPGGRRTRVTFLRGERGAAPAEEEFEPETFRRFLGPGG